MKRAVVATPAMIILTGAMLVVLLPTAVFAARSVAQQQAADQRAATHASTKPESLATPPIQPGTADPALPTVDSRVPFSPTVPADIGRRVVPTDGPPSDPVDPVHLNYGLRPPGSVELPYSPGQSSWSGVSDGVSFSMHADPASPRTGDVVHFSIEISSPDQPCCGLVLLYGDGFDSGQNNGFPCPDGGPQSPGTRRFETTHVYNQPGHWEFMLNGLTGNCRTEQKTAVLFGFFDVASGTTSSQGPSLPSFSGGPSSPPPGHDGDTSYVTVAGEAIDQDGFITGLVIDWGDGSSPEPQPGDPTCRPSASGWPLPSHVMLMTGSNAHHYSRAGTYRVTITVISTGCDGNEQQLGSTSFSWIADAPRP